MAPAAPTIEAEEFEQYRIELTAHCYRMLGSAFEAEDAVQDTMVRAWRSIDKFEGRSSLRSWLYRIATNVCLDSLNGRNRRARPMDFGPSSSSPSEPGEIFSEATWLQPIPTNRVLPEGGDPAEVVASRQSVRLAFVGVLQHLPPRQRAVLVLRDVLRWKASEVAELLDTSVASVNSALQRARATIEASDLAEADPSELVEGSDQALLERYVDAFERYDLDAFVALLADDVVQSMPPFALWLEGPEEVRKFFLGPGKECEGSRIVPVEANGTAAFAQYRPSGPGGRHEPFSIHIPEIADGKVVGLNFFIDFDGTLFSLFGLPTTLDPLPA